MENKKMLSRRFKYGAFATALTASFIVAVILFNVIVSALDSKFSFHIDLTKENVFTISDESEKLVDELIKKSDEENNSQTNIKITFLDAKDKITANEQNGWVVSLAESYAEKFDKISVEFKEDYYSHPENYSYYTDLGYTIDNSKIIVSNSTSKASFRIFNFDSCFVYDEDETKIWAFKGEMMLNSSIIAVTSKSIPVVAFTTGHGESKPEYLVDIFLNSGFTVKDVDLSEGPVDDSVKILVISNPKSDIISLNNDSEESEATRLSDYINDYRNLMVIGGPSTPELPVLDEFLDSNGLKLVRNSIICDDVSSIPGNNQFIYTDYCESEDVASIISESLLAASSPVRCVTSSSAQIEITKETKDINTFAVEPVLQSSANSYIEKIDNDGNRSKQSGPFNTMAVATHHTIQNNTDIYSHIVLIGSTEFSEVSAYKSQYGNTEIINNTIRLLSNESVKVDLKYKVLDEYELSDVEMGDVIIYAVCSAAIVPICIFALCIIVIVKRKNM